MIRMMRRVILLTPPPPRFTQYEGELRPRDIDILQNVSKRRQRTLDAQIYSCNTRVRRQSASPKKTECKSSFVDRKDYISRSESRSHHVKSRSDRVTSQRIIDDENIKIYLVSRISYDAVIRTTSWRKQSTSKRKRQTRCKEMDFNQSESIPETSSKMRVSLAFNFFALPKSTSQEFQEKFEKDNQLSGGKRRSHRRSVRQTSIRAVWSVVCGSWVWYRVLVWPQDVQDTGR